MIKTVELKLYPDQVQDQGFLWKRAASLAKTPLADVTHVAIDRRSIDARGTRPIYRLRCLVYINEAPQPQPTISSTFQEVHDCPEVHIIGAGPAGYFAGLRLLKLGLKPVIYDRGKAVQQRRRDLKAIQQDGVVNPHSNYCFGEGGAGTYSDGKLYTRSQKRGKIIDVLRLLVEHGAQEDILMDAHPHIGSNKLPKIVTALRETIESHGGEVHFDHHITDIHVRDGKVTGLSIADQADVAVDNLILATGHSARDVYELLHSKDVYMEAKPFALGCRIEHPQELIDGIQYNQPQREEYLPASSYGVVSQVNDVGVFSFCMCPGGLIVPAATAPGEIVVNGMSLSRRDSPYANSGFVTAISTEELAAEGYSGLFATLDFQRDVEQRLFQHGDGSQKAPAQRVDDFVAGRLSTNLNDTSYIPGVYSAPLHDLLPAFVYKRLRQGIIDIGKKMKGYNSALGMMVGVESRTSSPIRIPRDRETYMHEDVKGLFPCGEGAGYAGGILSACMDGENVAEAVGRRINE